jgi:glutamine synthetase
MPIMAEYIWVDGTSPSKRLRSKTRILPTGVLEPSDRLAEGAEIDLRVFPEWGADGSSTNQATGKDSDIIIRAVRAQPDPLRRGHYLVLCEVFNGDGTPHSTNTRHHLREVLEAGGDAVDSLWGFEQEYTFMGRAGRPLGFPANGFPEPQGPYYCAVGAENISGRPVYERFMAAAIDAHLAISGTNWEVMPGQAEFQIGAVGPLIASDHIWLARWLLQRIAEDYDVVVTLDAKPAPGDWNGAGMHTNFSTKEMREPGGMKAILRACDKIGERRQEHLDVYGYGYENRLTGAHETCSFREFRYGVADRTSSIRIPRSVAEQGHGYLEDRRPNANADPYEIAARILKTVCDIEL